jgi:hypothetical protein
LDFPEHMGRWKRNRSCYSYSYAIVMFLRVIFSGQVAFSFFTPQFFVFHIHNCPFLSHHITDQISHFLFLSFLYCSIYEKKLYRFILKRCNWYIDFIIAKHNVSRPDLLKLYGSIHLSYSFNSIFLLFMLLIQTFD